LEDGFHFSAGPAFEQLQAASLTVERFCSTNALREAVLDDESRLVMRYWWVNQNQTFIVAHHGRDA
jgi:hypothetical protein